MLESIESSMFVSHRARISGEFDLRKDLQTKKNWTKASNIPKGKLWRVKQFKVICLQAFDHMAIYHSLKLVSAFLYQTFIFYQMIALQKLFLFHLKSSFGSWDIQIFVSWPSPLFSLSAIALDVNPRKILKFTTSSTV